MKPKTITFKNALHESERQPPFPLKFKRISLMYFHTFLCEKKPAGSGFVLKHMFKNSYFMIKEHLKRCKNGLIT